MLEQGIQVQPHCYVYHDRNANTTHIETLK